MRLQRDLLGLEGLHTVPDFAPRLRKPGKSCGRKGRLFGKDGNRYDLILEAAKLKGRYLLSVVRR
jgi:hypothetical protein